MSNPTPATITPAANAGAAAAMSTATTFFTTTLLHHESTVPTCIPVCVEKSPQGQCIKTAGCGCVIVEGVPGHPDCTFAHRGAASKASGGKVLMVMGLAVVMVIGGASL